MISRFLRFVLVTALFFVALGLPAARPVVATPEDLYNNLSEDNGGAGAVNTESAFAQAFTTTATHRRVTQVSLRLSRDKDNLTTTTGNYSVEIWNSAVTGEEPGAIVGVVATADSTALSDASLGSASPIVDFKGLDITLDKEKKYYVVVRSADSNGLSGGSVYWDTTNSRNSTGAPSDYAEWNGSSWTVNPLGNNEDPQLQMQVIADWPAPGPTAVRMAGAAVASNPRGGLQIQWTSFSEIDTTGYVIARADSPSGTFTRLTPGLIPAQVPGMEGGSAYAWIDASAKPGQRYTYQISMLNTAQNEIDTLLTEGGYYQTYLSFFRH